MNFSIFRVVQLLSSMNFRTFFIIPKRNPIPISYLPSGLGNQSKSNVFVVSQRYLAVLRCLKFPSLYSCLSSLANYTTPFKNQAHTLYFCKSFNWFLNPRQLDTPSSVDVKHILYTFIEFYISIFIINVYKFISTTVTDISLRSRI